MKDPFGSDDETASSRCSDVSFDDEEQDELENENDKQVVVSRRHVHTPDQSQFTASGETGRKKFTFDSHDDLKKLNNDDVNVNDDLLYGDASSLLNDYVRVWVTTFFEAAYAKITHAYIGASHAAKKHNKMSIIFILAHLLIITECARLHPQRLHDFAGMQSYASSLIPNKEHSIVQRPQKMVSACITCYTRARMCSTLDLLHREAKA